MSERAAANTPGLLARLGFASSGDHRFWLGLAMAVVIALNTALFAVIDSSRPHERTNAISVMPTADIVELAFSNTHTRTSIELYVALGALAPGSTIEMASVTAEEGTTYRHFLFELSRIESVTTGATANAAWQGEVDPLPFVVARGSGGSGGAPWLIALDAANGPLSDLGSPAGYVADLVESGAHRGLSDNPSRDLILLEWDHPHATDDQYGYQILLIERSLLETAEGSPS